MNPETTVKLGLGNPNFIGMFNIDELTKPSEANAVTSPSQNASR